MKCIGKLISVCALLVAANACYALEKKGELVKFLIKNETGKTIYGDVYKTTAGGDLVSTQSILFTEVQDKECFLVDINKSLNRTSEYHRLIFSTNEYLLKRKLENSVSNSRVASTRIPQNFFKKESSTLCYSITDSSSKLRIKHTASDDKCTTCTNPVDHNTAGRRRDTKGVLPTTNDLELEKTTQSTWQKLKAKVKRTPKSGQLTTGSAEELYREI